MRGRLHECGDACVGTDVDVNNCGGCGTACKPGEVCSNGACGLTCAAPLATCGAPDGGAGADGGITQAFCAKVKKDVGNCGACGNACAANETCVDGACSAGCATASDCPSGAAKCVANKCTVPVDCAEIKQLNPKAPSGAYTIDPDGAAGVAPFTAYCDMVTDGGGWTIVAAYSGGDQENGLTSDTEASGNPLLFRHFNLNRAKKIALSALETESIFVRSDGRWLKADKPMFGPTLAVEPSHASVAVNLVGQNGASGAGFMGWSNHDIAGGGDFGITLGADAVTSCNRMTTNGFDNHSTNYFQLNCGCARHLLYSYSVGALDGDAVYKSSTALGNWNNSNGCSSAESEGLALYAAMRRHVAAPLASCAAIKTAQPTATDGWYVIDPDGAGGPIAPVGVYCDMTSDGGGYTLLPVSGGISTTRFDQPNSCAQFGMAIAVPRTLAHLKAMTSAFPSAFFRTLPGIYRDVAPTGGNPNYSAGAFNGNPADPCAMRSGDATKCSTDWKAVGGGAWFVSNVATLAPNGDYTLGCWLGWNGGSGPDGAVNWNDRNCLYPTGGSYLCSPNDK